MVRGNATHSSLELETHPLIDTSEIIAALPAFEMTKGDKFAERIKEDCVRLIALLKNGVAREVYVHGYIDENGIVRGRDAKQDDMIVTGIIDCLILRCKDPLRPIQSQLEEVETVEEFCDVAEKLIDKYSDLYVLDICDVKTRRWKKIPVQESVVDGSKKQVMVYDAMVEVMGESELRSLQFWEEYCRRMGVDIDEPISPELTLTWMGMQDIFTSSLATLRDIGSSSSLGASPYDISTVSINDPVFAEQIGSSLTTWVQPPTPRYFINILSRLFSLLSKFTHGDLRIQYYCRNEMFKELRFKPDSDTVDEVCTEALSFWRGTRPPKLMDRTYSNLRSKCSYCDFADYCSWKRDTEEQYNRDSIIQ